jgi:hypothetical protein
MSAPASTFRIIVRHSIWRVTLDGVFYGDYRSLGQATDSADAAAVALRAQGRTVTVVAPVNQ